MIFHYLNLLLFLFIASCINNTGRAQPLFEQVKIPLNNSSGVPFYYQNNIYYLEGFEVDEKENLYFLGGEKPKLRVFSNSKLQFSKDYTEFHVNFIKLINNKLYIFDIEKKTLFTLNKLNGDILKLQHFNITRNINSYSFLDSTIVFEYIQRSKGPIEFIRVFEQYSIGGKLIQTLHNHQNLSDNLYNEDSDDCLLGVYNDFFVFWSYNYETFEDIILVKNKTGDTIKEMPLKKDIIGFPFYGNPPELKLMRNNKIYILGHNNNEAIVTIFKLKDII